jgi:hypothetical protein
MPITGSLPIIPSRPVPAMASVFGGKPSEAVSKSWSDLWDEDFEEEEEREDVPTTFGQLLADLQVEDVKPSSVTTPVSQDHDVTIRALNISASDRESVTPKLRAQRSADVLGFPRHGTQEEDVFIFEDHNPPRYSPPPPRYTPPSRRDIMDKWAALGSRRRAYNEQSHSSSGSVSGGNGGRGRSQGRSEFGLGFSGFGGGVWNATNKGHRVDGVIGEKTGLDGGAGVLHPGAPPPDSEWVGGWHDLHL